MTIHNAENGGYFVTRRGVMGSADHVEFAGDLGECLQYVARIFQRDMTVETYIN